MDKEAVLREIRTLQLLLETCSQMNLNDLVDLITDKLTKLVKQL